jgi:hypothetical protein
MFLPPYTLTLTGNLITASYVFFSNLTGSQYGIISLLNQRLGPIDISAQQRARAFVLHLKKAGVGRFP